MIKCVVIGNFRGTCASVEMLKGYILICWNAEVVHAHLSECWRGKWQEKGWESLGYVKFTEASASMQLRPR